jgi:ABC-type branched-subunit amino acid transport system substrate-binding protein
MKTRMLFAVAALLVVAALAGCGSSKSSSSGGSSTSAASSSAGSSTAGSSTSAASGSTGTSSTAAGSTTAGGKPITILFVGDFSGANKAVTAEQFGGLKAGVNYWNAHGGFNGGKATVATINDNGDANTAVSQTINYLSSHPKPAMVWAGTESDEVAAMIPLMKREGLLSMSVNDGNLQCVKDAQTNCPTFFSIGGGSSVIASSAANAFKKMGVKSAGILEESLAFTQSESPAMQAALTKLGIKNSVVSFPDTAVDVTAEMSKIKSGGANGVYAEALGPAAGYALKARAGLSWDVPVIFDAAGSSFDISKLVTDQSQLKKAFVDISPPTNGCTQLPGVKLMVANAKAVKAPIGALPLYVAAFGWDGMVLLHEATDQAKSTDATTVASTIESLPSSAQTNKLFTLEKRVAFTKDNHENVGVAAGDYEIVKAGPVVNGQLHPTCKA